MLLTFARLAKDSPDRPAARAISQDLAAYRQTDMWWFGLIYSVTFGGYVGLSSFLPIFLKDQYALSPVVAGYLTALAALSGSLVRPLGGYIADRVGGGHRPLFILLLVIGCVYGSAALLLPLSVMMPLLIVGMVCLGLGNGAVFQLVPQRFRSQIGLATGFIGAIGGLGGFLLPNILGSLKQAFGSYGYGFATLSLLAFGAFVLLQVLVRVHDGWRIAWRAPHLPHMPHAPEGGRLPEASA